MLLLLMLLLLTLEEYKTTIRTTVEPESTLATSAYSRSHSRPHARSIFHVGAFPAYARSRPSDMKAQRVSCLRPSCPTELTLDLPVAGRARSGGPTMVGRVGRIGQSCNFVPAHVGKRQVKPKPMETVPVLAGSGFPGSCPAREPCNEWSCCIETRTSQRPVLCPLPRGVFIHWPI